MSQERLNVQDASARPEPVVPSRRTAMRRDEDAAGARRTRLHFLDVARAYAIVLALVSHGMATFGGWAYYSVTPFALLVTRTATPLFVFIFGMLLELVYVRRVARHGYRAATRRLYWRGVQCYLGYAITVAAGFAGGYLSSADSLRALVFLADAESGNILRLYCIMLALAPALIGVRRRFGPRAIVVLLALVWLGDLVLDRFDGVDFGRFETMIGLVFGTGTALIGPSVWHGFTFVLGGMFVARGLGRWRELGLGTFFRHEAMLLAVAAAVVAYLALVYGLVDLLRGFIWYEGFRGQNHIGYYALGLVACLVTVAFLALVVPRRPLPAWANVPLAFGRSSLLSFTLGNVLLNLVPPAVYEAGLGSAALPATAAFLVVMLVLVNVGQALDVSTAWPLTRRLR